MSRVFCWSADCLGNYKVFLVRIKDEKIFFNQNTKQIKRQYVVLHLKLGFTLNADRNFTEHTAFNEYSIQFGFNIVYAIDSVFFCFMDMFLAFVHR